MLRLFTWKIRPRDQQHIRTIDGRLWVTATWRTLSVACDQCSQVPVSGQHYTHGYLELTRELLHCTKFYAFIICPIAIAYSYGADNKIDLRMSVCLSVRVSSLSRSHFFVDFHQIWHRGVNPKSKNEFVGVNIATPLPLFYPYKSPFWLEVEIRPFRACAIKNMQFGPYLWPNYQNSCIL